MKKIVFYMIISAVLVGTLSSCHKKDKKNEDPPTDTVEDVKPSVSAPAFDADSAYLFIKKQVDFGPRVPNLPSHKKCGDYLVKKLKNYGTEVIEQTFEAKAYDGKTLQLRNIIGVINPDAGKRIMLAAHWDTRPFSDKDENGDTGPIDGANDGASGVGVLLEIARLIHSAKEKPEVGIDIIFFDGEDYGMPEELVTKQEDLFWWCLGSQHWSKNKHKENYAAYYGILLDMVGGKNDKFTREGLSVLYAESVVNKVWSAAERLGYSDYFINKTTQSIVDDHQFVNEIAKIPMIDIVAYDVEKGDFFGDYHHTKDDNMELIDKNTLKAVGQTVLTVIYGE